MHSRAASTSFFSLLAVTLVGGSTIAPARCAEESPQASFSVDAAALRRGLQLVSLAAGPQTNRYDLAGVLLQTDGKALTLVATDGARLATVDLAVKPADGGVAISGFLPISSVPPVLQALANRADACTLKLSASQLSVSAGDAAIQQPLKQPQFPNWRSIVPANDAATRVQLDANHLLLGVVRAAPLENAGGGPMLWNFNRGELRLLPGSDAAAGTPSSVPMTYDGESFSIHLDHHYLIPFLRRLEPNSTVDAYLNGPNGPVTFMTKPGIRYLVMPIAGE